MSCAQDRATRKQLRRSVGRKEFFSKWESFCVASCRRRRLAVETFFFVLNVSLFVCPPKFGSQQLVSREKGSRSFVQSFSPLFICFKFAFREMSLNETAFQNLPCWKKCFDALSSTTSFAFVVIRRLSLYSAKKEQMTFSALLPCQVWKAFRQRSLLVQI